MDTDGVFFVYTGMSSLSYTVLEFTYFTLSSADMPTEVPGYRKLNMGSRLPLLVNDRTQINK